MAPTVIISSTQSKLPRDFNSFFANGKNKTRLIELIRSVLVSKKECILADLKSDAIYFSSYKECTLVTKEDAVLIPDLSSSQEEANTTVMLHAKHALRNNDKGIAIIRSHSGDIDIAVIALLHFIDNGERVILDTNTWQILKGVQIEWHWFNTSAEIILNWISCLHR